MRNAIISALLALVLIAGVADAEDCQTASPEVTLETPAGTYYIDNDDCQPDCLFSIWVYEESNGEPGLQRGDEFCLDDGRCCEPDTIIL